MSTLRVAYHEAGHAIAARVKNLPIKKCSIVALRGHSDGYTKLDRPYRDCDAKDVLLFCLSGGAAEQQFTGEPSCHDGDDRDIARLVASLVANAPEDAPATDAVIRRFDVHAAGLVVRHWPWIARVAKALSRQRELSAAAIDELRWNPVRAEEQRHGHVSGGR